ncbi:MAG: hypothetical protein K6E31_02865, partial [bacterium]|nr:hypothetical protein [bacterium]
PKLVKIQDQSGKGKEFHPQRWRTALPVRRSLSPQCGQRDDVHIVCRKRGIGKTTLGLGTHPAFRTYWCIPTMILED